QSATRRTHRSRKQRRRAAGCRGRASELSTEEPRYRSTLPLGAVRDVDRPLGVTAPAEQDVQCAAAAVAHARAGAGEYQARPRAACQPGHDAVFEHRDLIFGVQTAAVDDQDAALALALRGGEEAVDCDACFLRRHAVQVEEALVGEITGAQTADESAVEP